MVEVRRETNGESEETLIKNHQPYVFNFNNLNTEFSKNP